MMQGWRIRVRGTVQGVGFRPFVWRLAHDLGLSGTVLNDGDGVEIRVWTADIAAFLRRLRAEAPALARIEDLVVTGDAGWAAPDGFTIVESANSDPRTAIAPDAATCPACRAEIADPAARRFAYAFTNCTDCGPRLSIIAKLPYDRPNTSMAAFTMCAACAGEYADPADRRFHAQPIACPACGPKLWLEPAELAAGDDAVLRAASLIAAGRLVAIKGIGGFHIAADARNADAVLRLRRIKARDLKPFALMARDVNAIAPHASVSPAEAALLQSPAAPIVLLAKAGAPLPEAIAPGQATLGFMLPYTPLHHLLMAQIAGPIILTSGNLSDEPQCTGNAEARERLGPVCDALLLHDREILHRVDDSVMRVTPAGPIVIRRARGLAPRPIPLPGAVRDGPPVLALGADLKATVAMLADGRLTLSPHIGDLSTPRARDDFRRSIDLLLELHGLRPRAIACDLHPDFFGTEVAEELAVRFEAPVIRVQHHHAHVLSCLADCGCAGDSGPLLGIALDGTGLGSDGTVWGGEFLMVRGSTFRRAAHFPVMPLPGGDAAAKEPWRNAVAVIEQTIGWAAARERFPQELRRFDERPVAQLIRVIASSLTPRTSSAGRLFDAVSALLGLCVARQGYEGEAAMRLEACAGPAASGGSYGVTVTAQGWSWHGFIDGILNDLKRGTATAVIARRAHDTIIDAVVQQATWLCRAEGVSRVALSGGCFNNALLLDGISGGLAAQGLEVMRHRELPPGDGGISAGQCIAAALQLSGR